MAAATPSRPFLCVVPSDDVLSLARELQGLGGNDVALAESTTIPLGDSAALEKVVRWLDNGFSATLVPVDGQSSSDIALLSSLIVSLAKELALAGHSLALTWAEVGSTKAVDPFGRQLSPVVGLRGAPRIAVSTVEELLSLLDLALNPNGCRVGRIVTLCAFLPERGTLSCFNAVVPASPAGGHQLGELLREVTELHARRHAGDHVLRTARLGLMNQFATPLIAGNARLFFPDSHTGVSKSLIGSLSHIQSVCSKVFVPEESLGERAEDFLVARRQHDEANAAPQSASPSLVQSSQQSAERRRRQRLRASASLQKAAARIAARTTPNASETSSTEGAASSNVPPDSATSDVVALEAGPHRELHIEVPEDIPPSASVAGSVSDAAEDSAAFKEGMDEFLPQAARARVMHEAEFEAARRHIRESTRSFPLTQGLSGLTSPSGAVQYGSPVPMRSASGGDAAPPPSVSARGYSAAYCARRGAGGSPIRPRQPSFTCSYAGGSVSFEHNGGVQHAAHSTPAQPVSDVFSFDGTVSCAPVTRHAKQGASPGEGLPPLEISLEGFATGAEPGCDEEQQDMDLHHAMTPQSASFSERPPVALSYGTAGDLEAELAQEQRINAVLLEQLQEAERAAANARARAEAAECLARAVPVDVGPLPDPGDFKGMLCALRDERRRSAGLTQQVLSCEEAKLGVDVELSTAQRELAIMRARCRALEREGALAEAFAWSEAALKSMQDENAALKRENAELAEKLATLEVDGLVRTGQHAGTAGDGTAAVIADLHKRLGAAHGQARKLRDELASRDAELQAAQRQIQAAEVNRRAAEEAFKRNRALLEELAAVRAELKEQCLAAAEAGAVGEELERARVAAEAALEGERERSEQLMDLCESLQRQMKVLRNGACMTVRC